MLLLPACDVQCKLDLDGAAESKAERKSKSGSEVEVEVLRTVCDELDFEVVRIVREPADPPFHVRPIERVSLRITNDAPEAVELRSGTGATFLDERRTIIHAELHQSEWFMPLHLPAKSAVVVEIAVPEGAGKALRTIETRAEPAERPFSECTAVDDLVSKKKPAEAEPPTETIAL